MVGGGRAREAGQAGPDPRDGERGARADALVLRSGYATGDTSLVVNPTIALLVSDTGQPLFIGAGAGAKAGTKAGAKAGASSASRTGARVAASCLHSFAPDTEVLLADGSRKPIKDVKVGDKVKATDPATGKTSRRAVTELHRDEDTDLVDLTVRTAGGRVHTLHTTAHHPFWNDSTGTWTDAAALTKGDELRTTEAGEAVTVQRVRIHTGRRTMNDLTVDTVHTYYVIAGRTPVLVHNVNGCGMPVRIKPGQQAAGGSYKMTKAELSFVSDLLKRKPDFQVYRADGKASMGDFLVIDKSNPRAPVGWAVELKASSGGFPVSSSAMHRLSRRNTAWRVSGLSRERLRRCLTR